MKNKRILIISGLQIFPPQSGGHIRTASIAQSLAAEGHQVVIYSFTGRKKDYRQGKKSYLEQVDENIHEYVNRNPLFGLLQFLSYHLQLAPVWLCFLTHFYLPSELRKMCREAQEVIVDFPFLYKAGLKSGKKFVLNTHNVESNLCSRKGLLGRIFFLWVRRIEQKAMAASRHVLFCTDEDCSHFKKSFDERKVKASILANGLNLSSIEKNRLSQSRSKARKKLGISEDTNLVLFSGSSYYANARAFAFIKKFCDEKEEVLRTLNIKFLVVGSVSSHTDATPYYYATSKVKDVSEYFIACDAAINPIDAGSGSNIKMFEYIAFRLPIFTTNFGARGLSLKNEESCFYFEHENLHEVFTKAFAAFGGEWKSLMPQKAYGENLNVIDMRANLRSCKLFDMLEEA